MNKIFILSIVLLLSNLVRGQVKTENDGFRWQMFSEDGFIGAKNEKGK